MQQSGTTGGADRMKGDSEVEADELDGFGSGGGRRRLGRNIRDEGYLELGNEELEATTWSWA
ncbi:hypothetical protein DPX16_8747 [Anabarilius grahami]|uniref:Uncharacterized protein n=1 Tax=Anabarilius grahami TaxID=495550 RepID=A0A3N0YDN8_ANAGA|nr:hypothetical protein DPX16_8747 [Anabarilius grahami]